MHKEASGRAREEEGKNSGTENKKAERKFTSLNLQMTACPPSFLLDHQVWHQFPHSFPCCWIQQRLSVDNLGPAPEKVSFVNNEPAFRWSLLQDGMAFAKLHEGIVKFAADAEELKDLLKAKLA
jgi:hypothetical protein